MRLTCLEITYSLPLRPRGVNESVCSRLFAKDTDCLLEKHAAPSRGWIVPRATKIRQLDFLHPDGWREVHLVWQIPGGRFKARLSLLNRAGERRAGYDWHYGKTAHRHFRGRETSYDFTTVDRLLADFARDVQLLRDEELA